MSQLSSETEALKSAIKKDGFTEDLRKKAVALLKKVHYWTKDPFYLKEYSNITISTPESRPFEEAIMVEKELTKIFPSLDQMRAV